MTITKTSKITQTQTPQPLLGRLRAALPLIMAAVIVPTTLWATWHAFQGLPQTLMTTAWILLGVYVAWILIEMKITAGEVKMKGKVDDRWTTELYALSRAITVFAALTVPMVWTSFNLLNIAGIGLFLFGIVFRLTAIKTLGNFYSHRVRLQDGHTIITEGPYRWVRHPAYAGMLAANLGFLLFFFNVYALAAFVLLFVPAILGRIRLEEVNMYTIDGYADYAQTHKRLVPLIW